MSPVRKAASLPSAWPEPAEVHTATAQEADPEILAMLADPAEHGGVLVAAKTIVARLLEQGLASKIVLSPSQLGVHSCNRSEYGINEEAVHTLGKNIMDLGFDQEAISHPWCVQEDPMEPYITKANEEMTKNSEVLAKVTAPIVAGTLTNSHVTLLLRCIIAGVPSEHPKLSVNKRMSLPQVEKQSPAMAHAAVHGWPWTMLHHQVKSIYGTGIFKFLSDAKNVSIGAKEREVEVLLKATLLALQYKKETGSIPWDKVHEKVVQTKPECSDYAHSLINFIKAYSGGDDPHFMKDFAKFHSKFVPGERIIGGVFFDHLTNLQIRNNQKVEIRAPLLKYAILKCQSSCPANAVQNRECKFVTTADLDKLARTKADQCVAAEALLQKSREVLLGAPTPLPELDRVKAFGRLDISVARVVLQKQKDSQKVFNHIEEPAFIFYEEVKTGAGLSANNPWSDHALPEQVEKNTVQAETGMQNYSCSGQHLPVDMKQQLTSLGFCIKAKVVPKGRGSTDPAIIDAIGNKVKLQLADGKKVELTKDDLIAKYVLYKEEFFTGIDAHSHETYMRQSHKNMIASAMYSLTNASPMPNLQLFAKPTKKVVTTAKYKSHELVLAPASLAVSSGKLADKPASASLVTANFKQDSVAFWLTPPPVSTDMSKKSLVAPFWLVPRTSDADKANMELHKVIVKVSMDVGPKSTKTDHKVEFEILRNSKPLKEGDELFVLQEDQVEQPKKKGRKF